MVGELFDKDGNLKQLVEKHNMILNAGFDFICDCIGKSSGRPTNLTHIAVGTDNAETK
jgi:hypothetical protein